MAVTANRTLQFYLCSLNMTSLGEAKSVSLYRRSHVRTGTVIITWLQPQRCKEEECAIALRGVTMMSL